MKTFKFTLVLFFLIGIFNISLSQTTYTWTGLGDGTSYSDKFNWDGSMIPGSMDNILFNTDASVIGVSMGFAGLSIKSGASVNFTFSDLYCAIGVISIEAGCSFSVTDANSVNIQVMNKADIYGNIFFDNAAHKLTAYNTSSINFYSGASFKTGLNFIEYPFGESSTNINTVTFKSGSTFFHGGGSSPFGPEGIGGAVTLFEDNSNYEIDEGNSQQISFSGRRLGNIFLNNTTVDVNVPGALSATTPFAFNTLTTLNGKFVFSGGNSDYIEIYGGGIDAQNGDVSLQVGGGGVFFSGALAAISGSFNVEFVLNSTVATSYNMVQAGNVLDLKNDLNLISGSGITQELSIAGTIDCEIYKVNSSLINLKMLANSTLKTANVGGVEVSIQSVILDPNVNIIYNGADTQNTGISSFANLNIAHIIINNPIEVILDNSLTVTNMLELNFGKFNIGNNILTLSADMSIGSGVLTGNLSGSDLVIDNMGVNTLSIPTPLDLNNLTVNRQTPQVEIFGTQSLTVNNLFNLQMGDFIINTGKLVLNGSFSYNAIGGASLIGGTSAGLEIGNTAISIPPLPPLVLGDFSNYSDLLIQMNGSLKVNNLLLMDKGSLFISSNTLTIGGDYQSNGGSLSAEGNSSLKVLGNTNGLMTLNFTSGQNYLDTLIINAPGEIYLSTDLNIDIALDLISGKLSIDAANIILSPTIAMSAPNIDSYIVTKGSGYVQINSLAAGTTFVCPVGTPLYKTEISYLTEVAGVLTFRVFDGVNVDGYSGGLLTYDDIIPITWEILSDNASTSSDITLRWASSATPATFDIANCFISHYTASAWDTPAVSSGVVVGDMSEVSRFSITELGLFYVSSHLNTMPTSLDSEVITAKNHDYIFIPDNFPFTDSDGDTLNYIKIVSLPIKGTLYVDNNKDFVADADEILVAEDSVLLREINLLKFKPNPDEIGDAANNFYYADFQFVVNDGFTYSSPSNFMKIDVTDNNPPEAADQTFTVKERETSGTLVGTLNATDPDAEQLLSYKVLTGDTLAFTITPQGEIYVYNPDFIVFTQTPEFNFEIGVIDNGIPHLFTSFFLNIKVEDPGVVLPNLEIANLITPNNDGHNDYWVIGGAPDATAEYETFIFDYSGKIIFHSMGYNNDWDGNSNGERLPQGVYYYLLRSNTDEIKGTLTLLR